MSTKKRLRKKIFVDARVQGALAGRVVAYWGVCLLTVTLMLLCWQIVSGPAQKFSMHVDDMWHLVGPALLASLVLLPMVVVDVLRLSSRFTGSLLRLRRSMRALADGRPVEPIHFRDGDFWQEKADDFNAVVRRVERAEAAGSESHEEDELEPLGVGD